MQNTKLCQNIFDDIQKIAFFKQCSTQKECLYKNIRYVDYDIMEKSINSLAWENYTLEQANQMSEYLFKKANQDFQCWNDYAETFRSQWATFEPIVYQAIKDKQLPIDIMVSVQWDLGHYYIMKSFYRHKLPKFFEYLFLIYQSGFLPCGIDDYENFDDPIILIY
ncbi:Uncharacterised protein [Moraxella lacunata]|uniref:Uncharacterized protein n=2 Tax=Moraxella lacunata TaxID=477 RepID=A0A378TSX7_MORLA|nr:Uncharacterised protein [Moraxella lacunata]